MTSEEPEIWNLEYEVLIKGIIPFSVGEQVITGRYQIVNADVVKLEITQPLENVLLSIEAQKTGELQRLAQTA